MKRRTFLATTAAASCLRRSTAQPQVRRPNLLFIHADQLHVDAIAAHGDRLVRTPNLDRLVAAGTSFQRSYSANPVCCPARSAWYTGRCSSETGVVQNGLPLRRDVPDLGQWLGARGYRGYYAGKWHLPARPLKDSFTVLQEGTGLGEQCDPATSRCAAAFLRSYREPEPWFLNLGFVQPHDICHWNSSHAEPVPLPYPSLAGELPPLPANFEYDRREPETFIRSKRRRSHSLLWQEPHWRYYLWSYRRQVEMVDAELGRVLDAVEDHGDAANTVIVFSADHGEGLAHHQTILKSFLYDEAVRVPLVVCWPDELPAGVQDREHLVSGLDLVPTFCALAGVPAPPNARGRNLLPLLRGQAREWREFVVSESAVTGRMVRTPEYKLIQYEGDATAQLFDLRSDPGETRNLAAEAAQASVLRDLRGRLAEWTGTLEIAPVGERVRRRDDPDAADE
ncbi:MAG: sulfatase-like hydrolase/transferase [Fimbriimonadaceae bacterium]|nr:sulfatase-like hydrolase/transferase [Fimbriimonadaceae bacterium]